MKQKKKPGFGKLEIKELSSARYERVNGKMVKGGDGEVSSALRSCECTRSAVRVC